MIPGLLRAGVSLALLALLAWWLDAGVLLDRLAAIDPRWALLAVAISLPQVALLAFRWRFTAGRLGLDLPFGTALREYYLAIFLNQFLPGAVMGDVSRAWRHGRTGPEHRLGPAARAVILERASGQVVFGGVAALSLASLPLTFGAVPATLALAICGAVGLTVVDGVAISAAYGILVLLSSLPGALVLFSANRDRRGGRPPGVRDGTESAATGPGSRSAAG